MKRKVFIFFDIVILLFLLISYSFAETITLKSGRTVKGKVIEKTNKYVKIDFQGVSLTYFLDEIENIDGEKTASPLPDKNIILTLLLITQIRQ